MNGKAPRVGQNEDAAIAQDVASALALAREHHQAGRLAEAEALYKKILAIRPHHAQGTHLLGVLAHQAGRGDVAIALMRSSIALDGGVPAFHGNLGNVLLQRGEPDAAADSFQRAIALAPDRPEFHLRLAQARMAQGRLDDAARGYERGLALDPNNADALTNLGTAYQALGRPDRAVQCFRRALELRPEHFEALYNLGNALAESGAFAESVAIYDSIVARQPDFLDAHVNRANAMRDMGRLADAEAGLRRLLAIAPSFAEGHKNLGHVLLLAGKLAEGWDEYEWRWRAPSYAGPRREFAQPRWQGEDIGGRTLLLHAEQGLGDAIQFFRYAMLAQPRGRIVIEVPRPLVRLFANQAGAGTVVAAGDPLPAFDLQCPFFSLPRVFHTDLESISHAVPYLKADTAAESAWRARLAGGKPRIGIAWSGNPRHANDRNRSVPLAQLAAFIERSGADWHAVQTDLREGDADLVARSPNLTRHDESLGDLADTAALMSCLDLIVSVDTAPAHLAGALGKPVWVLLPFAPDWRWMLGRADSPWYPTMRLFRQEKPGDWTEPIARVEAAFAAWLAGAKGG